MLLGLRNAHAGNEVAPEADYAGRKAVVRQVLNADVRHIEVCGVDAREILFPREACSVGPTRIEGLHVRVETGHDLDDGETFLHSVGSQRFETVWPTEPPAQAHPP